jgi:formate/nitrite transporter FocA (FNT family)
MATTEEKKEEKKIEAEAEERSAPSGKVVYTAILKEGTDELKRTTSALFWSGIAAGLSMGFSLIAEGLLQYYLPQARWVPLISKFGYSIGFLMVILGRQQLFTENTLTPILPLLTHPDRKTFLNVIRLWIVVFIANMIGALAISFVIARTNCLDADIRRTMIELGAQSLLPSFGSQILRGIFAGWLIALMVWLLPFAEVARVWVIIIITYVVGLGHFSHIIAGAVDVFTAAAGGADTWSHTIFGFIVPTFIGNVMGGVMLVAALNHAQIVAGTSQTDA